VFAAQACGEVSRGPIYRQAGKGVEQAGRQCALRFVEAGQYLGAGSREMAVRAVRFSWMLAVGIMFFMGLCF
jgi:uncharacterized ferredoxin-like protein